MRVAVVRVSAARQRRATVVPRRSATGLLASTQLDFEPLPVAGQSLELELLDQFAAVCAAAAEQHALVNVDTRARLLGSAGGLHAQVLARERRDRTGQRVARAPQRGRLAQMAADLDLDRVDAVLGG